jgi:hypothetical protein
MQSDESRLSVLEADMIAIKARMNEDRLVTNEYRKDLVSKVDGLSRLVFVGMGIVIALQFLAPIVLRTVAPAVVTTAAK